MVKKKRSLPKRRSAPAKALASRIFAARVVPDKRRKKRAAEAAKEIK